MTNNLIPPPSCSNCQLTPCQSGEVITSVEQVRADTDLAPNPNCCTPLTNWTMEQRGKTAVKSTSGDCVIVEEGTGATRYNSTGSGYWIFGNNPMFIFYCNK